YGIGIGAVGSQKEEPCSDAANGDPDGIVLVAAEVVHNYDVVWPETWHGDLFDMAQEAPRLWGHQTHKVP
ncbi:MAG: hypothetical protein WCB71_17095, partial [Aestuariivirga sp.]